MSIWSFFGLSLAGCLNPRPDKGDLWTAKLHIGMTSQEVVAAIGEPRTALSFSQERYLLYTLDRVPYDILKDVTDDTSYWLYNYPVNSITDNSLRLFFDNKDRLKGWVKEHSEFTLEKFRHEKLTSQIKLRMSRGEVYARIGKPEAILPLPSSKSPDFYEDRFWTKNPLGRSYKTMEVYLYSLASGSQRKVFLIYEPYADRLGIWGYDHAAEEVERFLHEQALKKK